MAGYHDIREALGGDNTPPWFVIHRANEILAATLNEELNPRIYGEQPEIWVGTQHPIPTWGERLADHQGELPVYVAPPDSNDYIHIGTYRVVNSTEDPEQLRERMQDAGTRDLCRVVFLQTA